MAAKTPKVYTFKEKTVTKIAPAITGGTISKHRLYGRKKQYIVTTRPTGATAPDATTILAEGVIMFKDHPEQEEIKNDESIDVYVYCNRENDSDSEFGKLVVWL